jgi:hypothetical protein
MLQIADSLDQWGYVLVAVDLRILELKKLPWVMGRQSSFCKDQIEGLERFATQLRKELRVRYEAQLDAEGRINQRVG